MKLEEYLDIFSHIIVPIVIVYFFTRREKGIVKDNFTAQISELKATQAYKFDMLEDHFKSEFYRISEKKEAPVSNLQEAFSYFDITSLLDKDFENLPAVRYLQVELYIDAKNESTIQLIEKEFYVYLNAIGFKAEYEIFERSGSLWKKFFAKSKEALTSPEVKSVLAQTEHALRLKHIEKVQSEVDKNQAEAIAALLKGAESSTHVAFRVGSLVAIKTLNNAGNSVTYGTTLTPNEMIELQKNPLLLRSPQKLMKYLNGEIDARQLN